MKHTYFTFPMNVVTCMLTFQWCIGLANQFTSFELLNHSSWSARSHPGDFLVVSTTSISNIDRIKSTLGRCIDHRQTTLKPNTAHTYVSTMILITKTIRQNKLRIVTVTLFVNLSLHSQFTMIRGILCFSSFPCMTTLPNVTIRIFSRGTCINPNHIQIMTSISALLALGAGNSQATGEFPTKRPVKRSFDVLFDMRLNKRLIKQSWGWWFETPSSPLWRQCNECLRFNICKTLPLPLPLPPPPPLLPLSPPLPLCIPDKFPNKKLLPVIVLMISRTLAWCWVRDTAFRAIIL